MQILFFFKSCSAASQSGTDQCTVSRMILLSIYLFLLTPPTHSLPSNVTAWIPLLESPCTHLQGPHCGGGVPMQDIGVVGAGMIQHMLHCIIYGGARYCWTNSCLAAAVCRAQCYSARGHSSLWWSCSHCVW